MENADYHLIKPVEGLPTTRQTTVDRQSRQGQRRKDRKQQREKSESPKIQEPLEMTEPDIIEADFRGDDPHAIDYRA